MNRLHLVFLLAGTIQAAFTDIYPASITSGSTVGFKIMGTAGNYLGDKATSAGDFNGDGLSDIVIASIPLGKLYVVFGKLGTAPFTNFNINTLTPGDTTGFSINAIDDVWIWRGAASIGDVNGDGIEDLSFGGTVTDYAGRVDVGAVFILYGRRTGNADINVGTWSSSTSNGFRIYGEKAGDNFGNQVLNLGDFNGDGVKDMTVFAMYGDLPNSGANDYGVIYVIFGKGAAYGTDIDMLTGFTYGTQGFRVYPYDAINALPAACGDVNNDGYADIAITASTGTYITGRTNNGGVYILFGHSTATTFADVYLSNFAASIAGFLIIGAAAGDNLGSPTSASRVHNAGASRAGDFNGDGLNDLVIGAQSKAYILFGRTGVTTYSSIDLASWPDVTNKGQKFVTSTLGRIAYVGSMGDFNGDGIGDVFLSSIEQTGWGAVMFGHKDTTPYNDITLETFTAGSIGFRTLSADTSVFFGEKADNAGDVNGDGAPDFLIAATGVDAGAGVVYLLYGTPPPPTFAPTAVPTAPSARPTAPPTALPTAPPTAFPTVNPTTRPTSQPSTQPSRQPSMQPSRQPTSQPSVQPSTQPVSAPSAQPSKQPSSQPTVQPSGKPSSQPSNCPSTQPSARPSAQPVCIPTARPSVQPSSQPSCLPTCQPSTRPSAQPVNSPTARPSMQPSSQPSNCPSIQPSARPSAQPVSIPTARPSVQPSSQPSCLPTCQPSTRPSAQPVNSPTARPSVNPSSQPICDPSSQPSAQPSTRPVTAPTAQPSGQPTSRPSGQPTTEPSCQPASQPSAQPSAQPVIAPSAKPSGQPSSQPSHRPTSQPSARPSGHPASAPTSQPTGTPSSQPSHLPSGQPSSQPSVNPATLLTIQASPTYKVRNGFAFAAVGSDGTALTWGEAQFGGDASAVGSLLHTGVMLVVASRFSFAAVKTDGSMALWGVNSTITGLGRYDSLSYSVTSVIANDGAFAGLDASTGKVIAVGSRYDGGDVLDNAFCNGYSAQLSAGVRSITASGGAFTAIKTDGTLLSWGNKHAGADIAANALTALVSAKMAVATSASFAVLLSDRTVATWGNRWSGGDSSAVAGQLKDVLHLTASRSCFVAFKKSSGVVVWGYRDHGGDTSAVSAALSSHVTQVSHSYSAMAALKADGTVVTWGEPDAGGDATAVQANLHDITQILANVKAFAALTFTGGVVTWGLAGFGGTIPADTVAALSSGVVSIAHTDRAFAALKSDGSVVVWGQAGHGGEPGATVAALLTSGVHTICANDAAFSAIKTDGSVVAWGHSVSVPVAGVQFTSSSLAVGAQCA